MTREESGEGEEITREATLFITLFISDGRMAENSHILSGLQLRRIHWVEELQLYLCRSMPLHSTQRVEDTSDRVGGIGQTVGARESLILRYK